MRNNFKAQAFRYKKILDKYRASTYKIQHYTQEIAIKYKEEYNQAFHYLINLYLIIESNLDYVYFVADHKSLIRSNNLLRKHVQT